jgi:predicted MFS family arabinose efflux permease
MQPQRTDWPAVAFGIALACLVAFQQFKLPPELPGMLRELGWNRTLAGGFMAVYALAGLAFSLPIGRLMQRRGMAGLLLLSFTLLLAGNFLTLLFPFSGPVVLLARAIEGVAFAVGAIAGPALAARSAAPKDIGLVIGLIAAWIPIGQLLAAGLALLLPGWRALWWAAAGITALVALWAFALKGTGALAPPGASPSGTAGGGPAPMSPRQRLELIAAGAIFLLWSGQYFAFMTWLPQYLVEVARLGSQGASAGYALPVAVLLGFNLLTGVLLGAGVGLRGLLLGALFSQAAVWWLIPYSQGTLAGFGLLVLYGIGAGITPTCLFALPGRIMARPGVPGAFAIIMTGRNIGVFLGPILLAQVTRPPAGWSLAWPLFGSATIGALLIAGALTSLLVTPQGTRR